MVRCLPILAFLGSLALPLHHACRAAEPATWRQTWALSAVEAHQAAAADESFVYAISSTNIARYDRHTGQRLATSRGEATHLNSGFFWQGKLYCAHSNYPKTPERSEIKVLDPQSMELTTFHEFGNFGGSLTWVVRHEGHWWCNFARYGDDNEQTFLVRFDNEWRETGRWTYPSEVIAQLGRHSLSGGLWWDDHLLVTGHDDPVLFRLRLPERGTVLEFVSRESIPFSGQGFARDPVHNGLVGIRRSERKLVFASSEPHFFRLRVLTYNIHHGEGIDRRLDLERIAAVIRSAEPDIVALQEVDRNVARTGNVDQPAELGRLTKLHVVFGDNIPLQGGTYGNAVLSRFPIRRQANHKLPNVDRGEQRGVLEVELELPGDQQPLLFLATHFDHRRRDEERVASARFINELASKHAARPMLLAGDLNDGPQSRTLAELATQWTRSNVDPRPTVPVTDPMRQIDYVLHAPADAWRVVKTVVLDEAVASDHRALLVTIELHPREKPN